MIMKRLEADGYGNIEVNGIDNTHLYIDGLNPRHTVVVTIDNPHAADTRDRGVRVNGEPAYGNGKELPDFAALDIFTRVRMELGE
jgi:hypothetical protein